MARKRTSTSFNDATRKFIEEFPSRHRGLDSYSTKAEEIITDYAVMIDRTKKELSFSKEEMNYIYDMLHEAPVYADQVSSKSVLMVSVLMVMDMVMGADKSRDLGEKWGVDHSSLSKKISSLTEFQAYVLVKMSDEYWNKK